jgi:hypothetical protein
VRLDEKPVDDDVEAEALAMSLRDIAKQVIQLMPELPREAQSLIDSIQEPGASPTSWPPTSTPPSRRRPSSSRPST